MHIKYYFENLQRRDLRIKDIGYEGVYWFHLAQGTDQWRDLVNTVMSLRVP
jgi:hypothetical protein